MTSERWEQIKQLFHAALEHEPAERPAFLARACAGDERLRQEAESLLASHEQAGEFIETPASDVAAALLDEDRSRLVGGQMVGPFRVVDYLATGGMGEVYLADDTRLGRKVALKLLPPQFTADADRVRRFEQEARAASSLNHPNIVTIHEIGETDSLHYIATEFVDGETLREHMANARMTTGEVLGVAAQVASALQAAHEAGVMHRDIKPENIMLRRDGLVKVLDFGLAKLAPWQSAAVDADGPTKSLVETNPGSVMGTAAYMSPEQARGLEVDGRTDIFSLGVMIYEMLAGRVPFGGATTSDVIAAILKDEPMSLARDAPEAPAGLRQLVKRALAKSRDDRYQTVTELSGDLQRLRGEVEPDAKTRHWRSAVLGLGVVLLVFALITVIPSQRGRVEAPRPKPTSRSLTFRSGFINGARFAPDGKTVLYSAGFDGRPLELFTTDVEGSESRAFGIPSAGIKSVSPAGEVAVLLDSELSWSESRNGTLAVVPLTGGAPRALLQGVDEADWAPDGKTLAIVRAEEGEQQLEYPVGDVLYRSSGWIDYPRVSPQGDKIAFLEHPLGDNSGSVAVLDLKTKKTSLVSTGWKSVKGLDWSPAGDEIWFGGSRVSKKQNIYAVTVSGRERTVFEGQAYVILDDISPDGRALVSYGNTHSHMVALSGNSASEAVGTPFAWSTSADLSADGKTLLFYEWGYESGHEVNAPSVYVRKLDGGEAVRLGEGKALALSPDGRWALAVQESTPPQLVLLPTGGGEPRALPNHGIKEYYYASWFPDGRQILFAARESGDDALLRSYAQDTESGEAHPLMDEGIVALRVSPDGRRVVAWHPEGRYYLYTLDGTTPTPIPGLESDEDEPIQWSADGRALFVRGPGDFASKLYRVEIASGRRRLWKEIIPSNPVGLIGLVGFTCFDCTRWRPAGVS